MAEYIEEDTSFIVDDDKKADWAIGKIKELDQEKKKWIDFYMTKVHEVENEYLYKTYNLKSKLATYFESLGDTVKETKTQFTYALPAGKLVLKKSKFDFEIKNEDELTDELEKVLPEYLKIKKRPEWAKLKKSLTNVDGKVNFITEDGEIIPLEGVVYIEKPQTFDIK